MNCEANWVCEKAKCHQINIKFYQKYIHTCIPLTCYPWRGSRGVSDIPPRCLRFTKMTAMRNTSNMTGGKPIAVWLQSISGGDAVNVAVVNVILSKRVVKSVFNYYIHNITPVFHWGSQRSLPSTCYDNYTHLSLLLSSKSSSTLTNFGLPWPVKSWAFLQNFLNLVRFT
jgi:hypothetical protein